MREEVDRKKRGGGLTSAVDNNNFVKVKIVHSKRARKTTPPFPLER